MIVRAAPPENWGWIIAKAGLEATLAMRVVEAIDDTGRIVGQAASNNWRPGSCYLHIAIDEPICLRKLIPATVDYLFNQIKRKVVIGAIAATNERSLKLAKHVGFKETHRIRDGHAEGIDVVMLELRADDARRWLEVKHG